MLVDDYLARIRRYAPCQEVEVKEASQLLPAVPADATLVALEVGGQELSSSELARRVERWSGHGKGVVAFVIGGAEGLPKEVGARAHFAFSLTRLTLPHRLARLILVEQIYRSFSILRGEPYARED